MAGIDRQSIGTPELDWVTQQNLANPTFDLDYEKIERFRVECWSLRSKVRDLRRDLREKEGDKSRADDKLIQRMSMEVFGLSPSRNAAAQDGKSIAEFMEECRNARDVYGPLEDECNLLEDQLSAQEFELTKLEKQFNRRWRQPPRVETTIPTLAAPQSSSPKAPTTPDIEEIPQDHPLVNEFESRLGDLDILKERLIDLEEERDILAEERDSRERVGISLATEDQNWLNNSQRLLDHLHESIPTTQADVDRLKMECLSRGLLDENGEPTDFQSRERNTFQDDEEMNSVNQMSEYTKHPILLPKPGAKHVLSRNITPESEKKSDSLGGKINSWILGQLRESPLEVNLLERTFQKHYGEIDDRWEHAVLAVWWDDGTAIAEGVRVYTSSLTTQAHLLSSHYSSESSHIESKLHNNEAQPVLLAHQVYFSPSPDHSDGTEKEDSSGLSSYLLPRAEIRWNQQ